MARELVFDIFAIDRASKVFTTVGASAETFGSKAKKAAGIVTLAVGAAVVGIGVKSVKMGMDFEEATTRLVTGAGESEKALDGVRTGLLAMAGQVGQTPQQLADGLYMINSAGYKASAGLMVLRAAAEGAQIGNADLTVVSDGLTTAMKDYHLPAYKAAEVTSKLIATVGAGKTNMGELSASMSAILPFTSALGIGFDETMGAMATMTGQGVKADVAATYLKFTVMSLANESSKGAKALGKIGLSSKEVATDLGKVGLHDTLVKITDALGKKFPKGSAEYNAALANIVGGTRGMGAALALTGKNLDTYTGNIKTVSKAQTEAGMHTKGWQKSNADLKNEIHAIVTTVQSWMTQLGMELIPKIKEAIDWTTKHTDTVKKVGIAIGVMVGSIVVARIAMGVWSVATGIWNAVTAITLIRLKAQTMGTTEYAIASKVQAMASGVATAAQWLWNAAMDANPIGLVIIAVGALIGVIVLIATKTTWFQTIWKVMTDALGAAWKWLWNSVLAPIIRFVLNGFASITDGIAKMLDVLSNIPGFGWAKDAADKMKGAADKAHALAQSIKDIPDQKTINIAMNVIEHASSVASGGRGHTVGGNATGTDNWRGGLSMVGERGPELVNLPAGAQVIPNDKTKSLLGKRDGASPDVVAAIRGLGDRLEAVSMAQTRLQQTMQRQMAGAR